MQWLKLTHDGDLTDLVSSFKSNKISGLSFIKLTDDDLKELGIKQLGLRDAFISARDQIMREYQHRQENHTVAIVSLDNSAPLNTTINVSENGGTFENGANDDNNNKTGKVRRDKTINNKLPSESQTQTQSGYFTSDPETDLLRGKYSNSSKDGVTSFNQTIRAEQFSNTIHSVHSVHSIHSKTATHTNGYQSPLSPSQSPDIAYNNKNNQYNDTIYTSSDIIFSNKKYLYIDLCQIVVNGYCRKNQIPFYYNLVRQQWNVLNSIIFDFYFEYERHIEQFGHDLWKTLVVIEIATVPSGNDIIRGFTGYRLIKHIKQYLPRYTVSKSDYDLELLCKSLIKYSYIRLAAITDSNKELIEKLAEKDKDNFNKNIFKNERTYLYQFENKRHRGFIKSDEPDRQSWYKSCNVQIYSSTLKGWTIGTIIDIQKDHITVQYDNSPGHGGTTDHHGFDLNESQTQQMRKTVDRYQDNVIKSTPQFIYARKNWIKDSQLEVFSNRYKQWFLGRVTEVLLQQNNNEQQFDILKVFYSNHEGKEFNKYVERWSKDLREVQQYRPHNHRTNKQSPQNNMSQQQQQGSPPHSQQPQQQRQCLYNKGSNVMVWSNSKQMWIPGIVIDIMNDHQVVNVRYGDFEKLMPWNSNDIRLCDENALGLLREYNQQQYNYNNNNNY